MKKKVRINFFQKPLDTKFRNFLFSYNQGDYLKYLKNRLQWYLYPNIKKVSPFPLHLDVEITSKCNLKCPMCASRHISSEKYDSYGHMNFSLFKKIIDEAAEHKIFSIRLSWRGEVFSNPDFLEYVEYAKITKKIPQVSFLTNGIKIDKGVAEKLIDLGVDYISVSVDGLDEMYEKIRFPSKFNKIYENLSYLKNLRDEKGAKKPLVRVTALWPAIACNVDEYYSKMSMVCDKIVYNPLKDYSINIQDREDFTCCQFLWERLFIGFDGLVHPCSNTKNEFVIDNCENKTIEEIWHGEQLNNLREKHSKGERLEVFPCKTCSYGVDFEKMWEGKDWSCWKPEELLP